MPQNPKITIILSEDADLDIKRQIQALSKIENSPYFKRSESLIAKMMLKPVLAREHEKYAKGGH